MKNKVEKNGNILKGCVILAFVSFLLLLIFEMAKDSIVISMGIRIYNTFTDVVSWIFIIFFFASIVLFLVNLIQKRTENGKTRKELEAEEIRITEEKEKERKERESLSVKRNLDSVKLKEMLMSYINGQWGEYSKDLFKAVSQLNKMDKQQEKLELLIQHNGAQSLSDTTDVLEKTEQYVCKNIRKVINYIEVADPNDAEARDKVEEKLILCCERNDEILDQTNDFLFALADFLNSQGDDDDSMEMLNMYKDTILKAIG